jgi:hypothetical protein
MENYKLDNKLRHSSFYKAATKALIGIYTLCFLGLGTIYAEEKDKGSDKERLDKITVALNKPHDSNPASTLAFIGGLGLLLYSATNKKISYELKNSLANTGGSMMAIGGLLLSVNFEGNFKRASLEDEKRTLELKLERSKEKD